METVTASAPSHDAPDGRSAASALRRQLNSAASLPEKLAALRTAAEAAPGLEADVSRLLSEATEKDLVFDDTMRLLKVWLLHGSGRDAERDYYLSA
ncbi:MAG: hypothetical protein KAX19_08360, partial [Candidatus Brocadiae bacterium]|nr:hypothetical protein [Candidatus Brocadiia bacterium]